GHPDLATGSDTAVPSGPQQVGGDGGPRAGLWDVAIDVVAELELLSDVIQGHDGSEFGDEGLAAPRRWLSGGSGGSQGGNEVISPAQGLLPDDGGLAVDASALAGVVVGPSADGFLDEAGHRAGHTRIEPAASIGRKKPGEKLYRRRQEIRSYKN